MKRKKMAANDVVFHIVNYFVFFLITLVCVYPFYYMIINTISANDLSANKAINFIPKGIHFDNYAQVLGLRGMGKAALISVARTVIGMGCTVLASAFLGFMFTQEKMWHRKFWYRFFVIHLPSAFALRCW